ncbi:hypothetical protein SO802_020320 [Lithocarpus litseifolius]|uniref:RNase H type-1 domain-containing protein n=1 Tax=Lithocarpus litseifolius TaxID=425828 RepID=A0AAW2CBN6_9ROSI
MDYFRRGLEQNAPIFAFLNMCDVDGATFAHSQTVGFWTIIHDHIGRVEAALSKHFAAPLGTLETEVKAMEERVLFPWDMGIRDIVLESDSMIVIDALMGSSDPPVVITNIIERTRQKLQDFKSIQLSHVKRQGNRPVYVLA